MVKRSEPDDAPRIEPLGTSALLLRFAQRLDPDLSRLLLRLARSLRRLPGVVDVVPSFASLAVFIEPRWLFAQDNGLCTLQAALREHLSHLEDFPAPAPRQITVPVCYGGEYGPDLLEVARHTGLAAEEVVARHAGAEYQVAFLGFQPGFPYLLGLDPALSVPRRATPRVRVPAGSVAIASAQTGIYPAESPGGWQLIGRTSAILFDAKADPPTLFLPGDRVRFRSISSGELTQASPEVKTPEVL